jgi:signal transduction histidine kinase
MVTGWLRRFAPWLAVLAVLAGVAESMSLWQENTRFPGLLRGLYLVRRLSAAGVLAWSGAGFVVLPAFPRAPAVRATSPVAAVVPFYMNRNLAEFPWRVVNAVGGSTIDASEGLAAGREPEAFQDLVSVSVASLDQRDDPRPDPESGSLVEPFLQAWLLRAQGEAGTAEPQPPGQQPAAAEARLEVFYPGGTLAGTVRTRQVISLAVSLGLTALLLAGVGVLTRLYRRSARLRASEQEFVASVSHELRTPIAVIQATSDNLRTGAVSDPARLPRYAEVIHGQVRRLSGMVESILLYAGLESGMARRPSFAEVDLGVLVEELTPPLAQLATERGARLAVDAAGLPPTVCTDRTALRLVVENLVANALNHAGSPEVRLAVRRPHDGLEIAVEDDGCGIPPREQARIFEPFVRGERSVREQRPGSGLGLHLVRRVVGLLGGKVTLESPYRDRGGSERPGCRFTVALPARERCDEA